MPPPRGGGAVRPVPRRYHWGVAVAWGFGMVLALAGTFLITTGGDPSQMALPPAGLAFGLLAALGGAGLAVFPGKILSTYGVSAVNGWAMLLVGLIAAPFVPDWGQAVASFDISALALRCFPARSSPPTVFRR